MIICPLRVPHQISTKWVSCLGPVHHHAVPARAMFEQCHKMGLIACCKVGLSSSNISQIEGVHHFFFRREAIKEKKKEGRRKGKTVDGFRGKERKRKV